MNSQPASGRASRDLCFIAEEPAPALQLAYPEGCAALRIALVTVPRVSHRSNLLRRRDDGDKVDTGVPRS